MDSYLLSKQNHRYNKISCSTDKNWVLKSKLSSCPWSTENWLMFLLVKFASSRFRTKKTALTSCSFCNPLRIRWHVPAKFGLLRYHRKLKLILSIESQNNQHWNYVRQQYLHSNTNCGLMNHGQHVSCVAICFMLMFFVFWSWHNDRNHQTLTEWNTNQFTYSPLWVEDGSHQRNLYRFQTESRISVIICIRISIYTWLIVKIISVSLQNEQLQTCQNNYWQHTISLPCARKQKWKYN